MQVAELMSSRPVWVDVRNTVQDAAARMRDLDVGVLPVIDEGRCVGVVTDRDITLRVTAAGKDPAALPVKEAMSLGVVTCHADDAPEHAAELMASRKVRRLVVVDAKGNLAGILSLGDLAAAGLPEGEDALRRICEA